MRSIKVGDNLSSKQLYLSFPDDLELGNVHKQIIVSANGCIEQTQANIIEMNLHDDNESVELFNNSTDEETKVNLITYVVDDDFGVVTSIDETSAVYKYIQIIEEDNYLRCNSHCKHKAYSKEEMNFLLNAKSNNSDVYLKNNFVVLTGEVSLSSGVGTVAIDYPDGLTKDNCVVLSVGVAIQTENCFDFGCHGVTDTEVRLSDSTIQLITKASSGPTGNRKYKIILLKMS